MVCYDANMGSSRTSYKFAVGFLLSLVPQLAQSAEPALKPWNFTARYDVAWTGMTIGRILITATEDATGYHMTVDTKTHGIATMFSKERRIAEASGTRTADGTYIPGRFESRPQDQDKGDHTVLTYDAAGKLANRTRDPDDDPNWRPPVPREQANIATDPITAGFIIRHALSHTLDSGEDTLSTHTYDGARLAQMRVHLVNPSTPLTIMDHPTNAIDLTIARQPIAGYTPKERKKFEAGDPIIHLYFTADDRRIPLRATIATSFGEISATLEELQEN